jgi:hypothetical protein
MVQTEPGAWGDRRAHGGHGSSPPWPARPSAALSTVVKLDTGSPDDGEPRELAFNRMDWGSVESWHECCLHAEIQLAKQIRAGAMASGPRRAMAPFRLRSLPMSCPVLIIQHVLLADGCRGHCRLEN